MNWWYELVASSLLTKIRILSSSNRSLSHENESLRKLEGSNRTLERIVKEYTVEIERLRSKLAKFNQK